MGGGVSTDSLTDVQKGQVMTEIAKTIDEAPADAPPSITLNQIKFAAAAAVNGGTNKKRGGAQTTENMPWKVRRERSEGGKETVVG